MPDYGQFDQEYGASAPSEENDDSQDFDYYNENYAVPCIDCDAGEGEPCKSDCPNK